MSTELEWKWVAERAVSLGELLDLASGSGVVLADRGVRRQVDVYLDGPNGEIASAGGGLRLRRSADDGEDQALAVGGATLCYKGVAKVVGQAVQRVELEMEWTAPELPSNTGSLPVGFGAPLGEHPLRATIELSTVRAWAHLECAATDARAELVADSVVARAAAGDSPARFDEVELEVLRGEPAAFGDLAAAIGALAGLAPSTKSKLQRAMELVLD